MKVFGIKTTASLRQYIISTLTVLVVALICFFTDQFISYKMSALLLLMTVSFLAMILDIIPVLLAAVLSAVIWNFFFIPPICNFQISNAEDWLMFLLYFIIALVNAVLTFKIRKAEKEARDKKEKENTIKLYNTLLNSLSHEFRTPISTILGAVDTLQENKDKLSVENQDELLSEIDNAAIRLDRQVENLLNISRLESGTLQPKYDWCDVHDLVNSVIQKLPEQNTHTISFNALDNLPLFKIDAGFTEQILYNLLHNAVQYTPEYTHIDVQVEHLSDNCVITISDNGTGFPEDNIAFVFDKFYRLPNTKTGGNGLGLSIVKGFVEAQKGTIALNNNEKGGATFTIAFPAKTTYINHLKNE